MREGGVWRRTGPGELPPYAFVPGGSWPHPNRAERRDGAEANSEPFARGVTLFNAGYYWEAHEAWEVVWHSHQRRGPTADLVKALIKLAAAGVKVRQRQPNGVVTHALRAASLIDVVRRTEGADFLGLDLDRLADFARTIAADPPADPGSSDDRVVQVFAFRIERRGGLKPRD